MKFLVQIKINSPLHTSYIGSLLMPNRNRVAPVVEKYGAYRRTSWNLYPSVTRGIMIMPVFNLNLRTHPHFVKHWKRVESPALGWCMVDRTISCITDNCLNHTYNDYAYIKTLISKNLHYLKPWNRAEWPALGRCMVDRTALRRCNRAYRRNTHGLFP